MTADRDIEQWLREEGFGLPEARAQARRALEDGGLTRPGKQRISTGKIDRARALLRSTFALHCESPECLAFAQASGRAAVRADPKGACVRCGGSANVRAESALLEACRARGVSRVVVVGGSPAVREELEKALGSALQLRLVDGTERRTADRAKSDLEWADLVLIWGASELHHKVSWLYTQGPPQHRKKVVLVARRGVAALLDAAVEHLQKA